MKTSDKEWVAINRTNRAIFAGWVNDRSTWTGNVEDAYGWRTKREAERTHGCYEIVRRHEARSIFKSK